MDDSAKPFDIDSPLCSVPAPQGLEQRLKRIANWDDETLDFALRCVSVPSTLAGLCRALPESTRWDEQLRSVAVPSELQTTLRAIPSWAAVRPLSGHRTGNRLRAISHTILVLGVILSLQMGLVAAAVYGFRPPNGERSSLSWYPASIDEEPEFELETSQELQPSREFDDEVAGFSSYADRRTPVDFVSAPVVATSEVSFRGKTPSFVDPLLSRYGSRWKMIDLSSKLLGVPNSVDKQPIDIELGPSPTPAGIRPPAAPGYDRTFLFRHRTNPITSPRGDSRLATVDVPLHTGTESWQLALERVSKQRPIHSSEVRVEDFLASMPYGWRQPVDKNLEVHLAAGPSEYGEAGAVLVQVGVKAGRVDFDHPSHLVVLLDTSLSMGQNRRLHSATTAIRNAIARLGPQDRYSILTFHDDCRTLVDAAGLDDFAQVSSLLQDLTPAGGTNLVQGIHAAAQHVKFTTDIHASRQAIVVITDEDMNPSDPAAADIQGIVSRTKTDSPAWLWVHWGADIPPIGHRPDNRYGMSCVYPSTLDQLQWSIWEFAAGRSSFVARNALMQVHFNPASVVAYRLLGHEATSYGGLLANSTGRDLRVGDEATVLFEIWLRPATNGTRDSPGSVTTISPEEILSVDLQWSDADEGDRRSTSERLTADRIAQRWEGMEPALKLAAVVAEAAEVLRGSYFVAPYSRHLRDVRNRLERLSVPSRDSAEFRAFVDFVQRVEWDR